jgi:hypothetical protein
MRIPHFLTLVQVDKLHFISACRSGVVHLTWGRATVRFDREEFRRLARLLERAADIQPPTSLRDGELIVTRRPDEESEFRMGPVALLLSPSAFQRFAEATRKAVDCLDDILASGVWDRPEAGEGPPDPLDEAGRNPFSQN